MFSRFGRAVNSVNSTLNSDPTMAVGTGLAQAGGPPRAYIITNKETGKQSMFLNPAMATEFFSDPEMRKRAKEGKMNLKTY